MSKLEEEAIEFIKQVPQPTLVGFSGGKDSIVTAKLVELAGIDHILVYSNTTLDPPEVTRFIRKYYPQCQWANPTRTFWKMMLASNPPTRRYRWCCTALKKRPTWKFPHKHRIMGTRAEESPRRKNYPRINFFDVVHRKKLEHYHYYPILDWKEWQLWEFIDKYGLEYPSLYDEGFDRLGCVVCPFRSKKETLKYHQIWMDKYPGYFKAFEKAFKKWWEKRIGQGREMYYATVEEAIEAWYRGTFIKYKYKENNK